MPRGLTNLLCGKGKRGILLCMNVTVNGKAIELQEGGTVLALLDVLGLSGKRVAVEHNKVILTPEKFASSALRDGDTVEVLSFVGGG